MSRRSRSRNESPLGILLRFGAGVAAVGALVVGGAVFAPQSSGPDPRGIGSPEVTTQVAVSGNGWLAQQEALGGHTLARHVGKDERWLRARLDGDPNLNRASAFPDQAAAEREIGAALAQNGGAITDWLRRAPAGDRFTIVHSAGETVGISVARPTLRAFRCSHSKCVLQSLGGGRYFVLSAYPD